MSRDFYLNSYTLLQAGFQCTCVRPFLQLYIFETRHFRLVLVWYKLILPCLEHIQSGYPFLKVEMFWIEIYYSLKSLKILQDFSLKELPLKLRVSILA